MTNKMIWQQVAAFRFNDDQSALTFTQRLARESGWSLAFAGRVIEEYKRFIYLAACAGHPVTPSDEVDQAWHLHMVYTRSYWQDLCEGVLGKPLHHGPTKGGRAEGDKFHDWYERTLASYRVEFNAEPPSDIWPPSAVRFSPKVKFQRVDVADVWMISKTKLRKALTLGLGSAAMVTLGIACSTRAGGDPEFFPIFFIGIVVILIIFSIMKSRKNGGRGDGSGCGSGCSSGGSSCGSSSSGHSGCGSHGGHSGCGSDGGSSGCGSSCGSGCGGGCGGGD